MSAELTRQQAQAIYSLVFAAETERRPLKSKLPLDKPQRDRLVTSGLLELEPAASRGERVNLTDKGWAWAAANLGAVELSKSQATVVTLQNVLALLQRHLAANDSNLASFVSATASGTRGQSPPLAAVRPGTTRDLASRIRATCLELGRGAVRTRVRLRELRARMPDVARERLDHELVELQNSGALVLYRIDDPTDIQPADERAALLIAGAPRHILYLEH